MTLQELFQMMAWVGIPVIGGIIALVTTLWSIKSDLRRIEATIIGRQELHEEKLTRLEKLYHELRTDVLALRIKTARLEQADE